MPMVTKLSVILTCFNGEKWIAETIKSVLTQTFVDFELIIINDGSTDKSEQKILSFSSDKRIKYFSQENIGIPGARNVGIRKALGEYVCILDQDDLWLPEKLAREVEYLDHNRDVGVVYTGACIINEKGEVVGRRTVPICTKNLLLRKLIDYNFIPTTSIMMRRECFDTIGLLDETLYGCDDYDLWLRAAGKYHFGLIDMPLVKVRYHQEQASHSERMFSDRTKIFEKILIMYPLYQKVIQDKLSGLYYVLAQKSLANENIYKAKSEFLKSIRLKPCWLRPWIWLIFISCGLSRILLIVKTRCV